MKTHIELDDVLVEKALKLSKSKTKKAVVELALETLIKSIMRHQLLDLKGKIQWRGNLKQLREH